MYPTEETAYSISQSSSDLFMKNVLDVICRNLGNEAFGVDLLRKELGLNERQLQRKVKANINQSSNQLINSTKKHSLSVHFKKN